MLVYLPCQVMPVFGFVGHRSSEAARKKAGRSMSTNAALSSSIDQLVADLEALLASTAAAQQNTSPTQVPTSTTIAAAAAGATERGGGGDPQGYCIQLLQVLDQLRQKMLQQGQTLQALQSTGIPCTVIPLELKCSIMSSAALASLSAAAGAEVSAGPGAAKEAALTATKKRSSIVAGGCFAVTFQQSFLNHSQLVAKCARPGWL